MFCLTPYRFLPRAFLLVLAGVMLPSGSAQQSESPIQQHFMAAQQDQQQGQLDAAAREYKAVLQLQPKLPEAYINLGLVYYAQSNFEESVRSLTRANQLRPGMRGVSLWLGIDNVKLHHPAQGATFLREAVRLDPADQMAQNWLGTALWDAGEMDAALLQLRRAAALSPNDPDLLFALGEAYGKAASQQTGQLLDESSGTALSDLIYGSTYAEDRVWSRAEDHLRRAIVRDPHLLDARLALANVFLEQARLPAAQEQLDAALALTPQSASALALSGELQLLMQQPGLSRIEQAIAIDRSEALDALGLPPQLDRIGRVEADAALPPLCRAAIAKLDASPASGTAKDIAIAALYALAGDEDSAQRAYRRVSSAPSTPKPLASRLSQAVTALHERRYGDAEALLVSWLKAHPADRMARYRLTLARRRISMEQLARLQEVAPDSYHVHQLLGQLYVNLTMANDASGGQDLDDKAIDEYLAVAAAKPDLPDIHFWLGHLYWKHGDADHALPQLKRELQLDPGHPEANGELGAILLAQGDTASAIPHLESAIRVMPDLWPVYLQLGRAYTSEKNYPRAELMLNRALEHDRDGSIHYQLGLVLRAEGKTAQATQIFAQVKAIKNEKMFAKTANETGAEGAKQ
jgi:tetratricopeptide (TPR) repeat protein